MSLDVDAETFEQLVVAELDALPDAMFEGLDNVAFVIEDAPATGDPHLLGEYDGVALTERGEYGYGEIPDRIVLYRLNLLAYCENLERLKEEIRVTLAHEIGHYYGLEEDRLHELGYG